MSLVVGYDSQYTITLGKLVDEPGVKVEFDVLEPSEIKNFIRSELSDGGIWTLEVKYEPSKLPSSELKAGNYIYEAKVDQNFADSVQKSRLFTIKLTLILID